MQFESIPILLRPDRYIEFSNANAVAGLVAQPHKMLIIGQRLTNGSVQAEVPTRITSASQGAEYFGRGSMLADMIESAITVNRVAEMWAVALDDDGAGVAATGDINFTGPATAAGTLQLYIGGQRVRVAVSSGDSADAIATAVAAAVTADTSLPVTAAVNGTTTSQVDFTARNKGEAGNGIDIRTNYNVGDAYPAGVGATVTAMSGGTGNPDIALAIAAIGSEQYNTIIMPYSDSANLTALQGELSTRWDGQHSNDGHAYTAIPGTFSAISTLADARNDKHITGLAAGKSPTLPWVVASLYGAVSATQTAPSQIGRPLQTLALTGMLPPAPAERFTDAEREQLLNDGAATFHVDAGGICRIERAVTFYKTNAGGSPDPSYRDTERLKILSYLRFSTAARISQKYPRHSLKDDDGVEVPAGAAIATPSVVRDEVLVLFQDWQAQGLVEDFAQFKADLVVEIDAIDKDRINAIIPANCINGFRVFAGQIDFRV